MLNKESFIDMITLGSNLVEESDRWSDFGIDIYEMDIYEIPWGMFNIWMKDNFDTDGQDWINWYFFERLSINTNEVLPCYHEDGTKFYVNNAEDLWDLVKDHLIKLCPDAPCSLNGTPKCIG